MFAHKAIAVPVRRISIHDGRGQFRARLLGWREWLRRAVRNHRTRQYLTDMDDRTLADLGVSRAQARFEASRWWWN